MPELSKGPKVWSGNSACKVARYIVMFLHDLTHESDSQIVFIQRNYNIKNTSCGQIKLFHGNHYIGSMAK